MMDNDLPTLVPKEKTTDRAPRYKVVETSTVTDEVLEDILNTWTGQGWKLEHVQFVMREASKRPAMAFVFFIQ